MIRISKKTKKSRDAVRKKIDQYFGKNGLGLNPIEPNNFCAYFEGSSGYVAVNILEEEYHRVINALSMEWEYHAKQFLLEF